MKTKKLVSMVQFILDIDWMTTVEFCKESGAPSPTIQGGANAFLQVDAIKHRMFVEYAKFLNKKLSLDMFAGERPVFKDFEVTTNFEKKKVLRKIGSPQVYAYIDDGHFTMHYPMLAKRVEDLTDLDIEYYDTI